MLLKLRADVYVDPERVLSITNATKDYPGRGGTIQITFDSPTGVTICVCVPVAEIDPTMESWTKEINAALRGLEDRRRPR